MTQTADNAVKAPLSAPVLTMPPQTYIAEEIQKVWAMLHAAGRNGDKISLEGRNRIHQAIGAFHFMWAILRQRLQVKFKNREQAVSAIVARMQTAKDREALAHTMSIVIPMMYSRHDGCVRSAAQAAKKDPKNRRTIKRHKAGSSVLTQAFWRLLALPLLSEASDEEVTLAIDTALWWQLNTGLRTASGQVLEVVSQSSEINNSARDISEALDKLRLSVGKMKGDTAEAPKLAVLGSSLETLAKLRGRLWTIGEESPDASVKAKAEQLRDVVEKAVYMVVETGTFAQMS